MWAQGKRWSFSRDVSDKAASISDNLGTAGGTYLVLGTWVFPDVKALEVKDTERVCVSCVIKVRVNLQPVTPVSMRVPSVESVGFPL